MEAAEVEKLTKLDSQGMLLHVHCREGKLQAVIAAQELIDQEVARLRKKSAAMKAQVAVHFWRQHKSPSH